jgi:hypothetical protein
VGGAGAYSLANASGTPSPDATRAGAELNLVLGGAMAITGGVVLATRSSGERLRDDFVAGLRLKADPRLVVADTEQRLRELAEREHTERLWLRWSSVALTGAGALGLALTQTSPWYGTNGQAEHNAAFASDVLVTGIGISLFVNSLFPTPLERMWKLWSEDPGFERTSSGPSVHVTLGLGGAGVSGTF